MRVEQNRWWPDAGWSPGPPGQLSDAQLLLVFGERRLLRETGLLQELTTAYPAAELVGCSTSGEICATDVTDCTIVATAVRFDYTTIRRVDRELEDAADSGRVGGELARALGGDGLVHVLVLSEGLRVNGSALVRGLVGELPAGVQVTGGLAGDGDRFEETTVLVDRQPRTRTVTAVGFYGPRLRVGYGSLGGWDPFGPERLITRSAGNVLYEVDGRSALTLYKRYLGDYARGLPATALLFPLSLRPPDGGAGVVRTVLSIDEREGSMTFAGDLPEGHYARLMKANFERLIDGATGAAKRSYEVIGSTPPDLALLISCVGRKMVLKQRIEEEVESVREILGDETVLAGFYSYGEISPFTPSARCELHNQTMTITTLSES